jgi:4-hydroxybenzoate polyprenyltransferase
VLDGRRLLAVAAMSVGLYGFGMSLNDIIDRRRDRQLAAERPLPSGRMGVITAHVICIALLLGALLAGWYFARRTPGGEMSLLLVVWVALLITFYDFAGKYLVAPGLLTLGLIRFFHATIPAPQLPLLWHPLLLLNHVTILSMVAYHWEQKRPPLTRLHWWSVPVGLLVVNLLAIAAVWYRRGGLGGVGQWRQHLWIEPGLLLPLAAAGVFVVLGWLIYRRAGNIRHAGQRLMLLGLLWLIVYDAAFVAGYVGWGWAGVTLLLLPVAYLSVQAMRWWSRWVAGAESAFRRVGQ